MSFLARIVRDALLLMVIFLTFRGSTLELGAFCYGRLGGKIQRESESGSSMLKSYSYSVSFVRMIQIWVYSIILKKNCVTSHK